MQVAVGVSRGGHGLWGTLRRHASSVASAQVAAAQIPEPRGLPILGSAPAILAAGGHQKLHEYVDARHRKLGPIYADRIGPVKAVFVSSPDEYRRIFRLEGATPQHFIPEAWMLYNEMRGCRRGLLFMDGEEWLHFRRTLNKVLLAPNAVSRMLEPCQEAAEDLVNKWKTETRSHRLIQDLQIQLYQWSIEAVLATLMGSSWRGQKGQFSGDIAVLARMLHKIFECTSKMSMISARWAMQLRLPSWNKFVACFDSAMHIVNTLVPEMVRVGGDGLLRRMLDEGIQSEDAIRIVADFILAAGDTTASSMQWALYLLSRQPECQENLYRAVSGLSASDAARDPLVRGTMKETLRLYPVASFITRYLPEDNAIGGYIVPKGQLLLLSMYTSSRDPSNFPRPNEFCPERWLRTHEGNYRAVLHPHGTLPFALGARSCIGRKLAETQMSLALAELVKAFQIDCVNKDRISMILHLTAVPSELIQLKLVQRQSQ